MVPTAQPSDVQAREGKILRTPGNLSGRIQWNCRFPDGDNTPSPLIVEAIEAAVLWIDQSQISGIRVKDIKTAPVRFQFHTTTRDRIVVNDSDAPPIWTRYYEIDTNRPFFCNRDGIKVYSLAEVHRERRTGYSWYSDAPRRLIEIDYPVWKATIGNAPASPSADSN